VGSATIASAQLTSAKEGPVVYGHHHLNTTNMDAQKKFFVDTLGGTLIKVGTNNAEIVKFPNVLIFFRATQAPTGGTRGTTVNHIGFSVPNLRPVIDKIKANGFKMITDTESPGREVKDDIAGPLQPGGASIAFAQGPDDLKVEFVEAKHADDPDHAPPRALLQPEERRDAGLVREDVRAHRADWRPVSGRRAAGVALNFSPSTDSGGRNRRARARSRRLRSQEPRGIHQKAGS
jgi:catechol 2,3-dioxygenase-like lactoylglutathione lyase family enzyme